ncbi:hypothetical protein [Derxia gummosa]|uniref:Uncharacterized protein n=1 Tax=Derxia gummosa DSM 723 TaxID=1121388 RepID=A0A8B6XAG0_9BURK|nr:hypothetical protein [Derxia gummosa]
MQLLVPDLLVPRAVAPEVLADLQLPALQALMAQTRPLARESADEVKAAGGPVQFSRPASRWLARRFGIARPEGIDGPIDEGAALAARAAAAHRGGRGIARGPIVPSALPEAALRLAALGVDPGGKAWWCVEPCAYTAATDHVVLSLLRPGLTADEAAALLDAIRPSLEPLGIELLQPTPDEWFLHWPALDPLRTAEPLRALGRNIDLWGARGPSGEYDPVARHWRRLHNEIQMSWHEHPVLAARKARGAAEMNGLWVHGGGALGWVGAAGGVGLAAGAHGKPDVASAAAANALPAALAPRPDQLALRALARLTCAAEAPRRPDADALVLLDELEIPAAREQWADWRAAIEALERDWFAPLLASGRRVELIACSEHDWRAFGIGAVARWKFWARKGLLDTLAVEPPQED